MRTIRFNKLTTTATAIALGLSSAPALANTVALESDVMVERTVVEDGVTRSKLLEPTDVVPGDRLLFVTSFTNNGDWPIENFVLTNPMPSAVSLAAESSDFEVSVDGGKNYASLSDLTVDEADGAERAATLRDVTHIRWTLKRVEPGAKGSVQYHALVR